MLVLLLAAILCSVRFRSGQAEVVLTPTGEVQVCITPNYVNYYTLQKSQLTLTCTAQGALWSTTGLGEGVEDQTRVPAVSLASSSTRVTTTDSSMLTNTSRITLSNFTYDDHGATISCDGQLPTDQQKVTLSVGPTNCTISLTASRVTADSAVIRWNIHNCLGTAQANYSIHWYAFGRVLFNNRSFINFSTINEYKLKITGLSPGTRYIAIVQPHDYCASVTQYTVLVETVHDVPANCSITVFSLAAVIAVLFLLLLILTTVLMIVCIKSKFLSAVAIRKPNGTGGRQGGGLEQSKQHESAYQDTKPTTSGIQAEENPAYQSMETALYI